ncbi:MAG: hypothetical protein H6739_34865 [Alphaproteobacteria bacterium]|nr:hypothetical protein [Alphaproteobacteria bacterium]
MLTSTLLLAALGVAAAADPDPPWRLVAAYDLSDAMRANPEAQIDWAWRPDSGMNLSCGPTKSPDGLGLFDAEVIAQGLSPTLALLLERQPGAPAGPLTNRHVRVAVGKGSPEVLLQPATLPRSIMVELLGAPPPGAAEVDEDEAATWQLIRRQLEMLLCLEHKVGRGWIGGDEQNVRQAILLAPPDKDLKGRPQADRKYFGGQRDPAPPMLGPPRACILGGEEVASGGVRGQASVDLVPADLWGATLDRCPPDVVPGMLTEQDDIPGTLPIVAGDGGHDIADRLRPVWGRLSVAVVREDAEACIRVEWEDGHGPSRVVDQCVAGASDASGALDLETLPDLLAEVPLRYPAVGPNGDRTRYALLLVPNWQLVEAVSRVHADAPENPMRVLPSGVDAVSWVLNHPEELFVQVKQDGEPFADWSPGSTALELTGGLGRGPRDLQRRWGYMVGLLAGRQPIALVGETPPTWGQVRKAQRAEEHAATIAGLAALLIALFTGLVRLPELWRRVPEERAAYWPGRPQDKPNAGEGGPDGPGTTVIASEGA